MQYTKINKCHSNLEDTAFNNRHYRNKNMKEIKFALTVEPVRVEHDCVEYYSCVEITVKFTAIAKKSLKIPKG